MTPAQRRLPLSAALFAAVVPLLLSACLGDSALPDGALTDGTGLVGFSDEVLVDGLDGPTQLFVSDDGSWWLAQLAGGENDRSGQVLRLDSQNLSAEPSVVLEGLDKPTGVAVFAGEIWVMERDRLTRGPIDGLVDGSDRTVVADDLPNNGRSQGTLTVDVDRLLYNTSGRLEDDGTPTPGAGTLWAVTVNADTAEPTIKVEADGFKHAYAHVRASDGILYTTEINDGRYDGQPAQDELVAVTPGVDHGWPQCVGDNRLVAEYVDANGPCPDAPRSKALFEAGATPTGLAQLPDPFAELLAVALWNTGQIVAVPTNSETNSAVVLYEGVERPQHLVLDGDRLLLTDYGAGTIVVLTPITDGADR